MKAEEYEMRLQSYRRRFVNAQGNGLDWNIIRQFRELMQRAEEDGYAVRLDEESNSIRLTPLEYGVPAN